jgi:hypothetical protein
MWVVCVGEGDEVVGVLDVAIGGSVLLAFWVPPPQAARANNVPRTIDRLTTHPLCAPASGRESSDVLYVEIGPK